MNTTIDKIANGRGGLEHQTVDDQLGTLNNCIEYLLKEEGKFKDVPESVFYDFLNNKDISSVIYIITAIALFIINISSIEIREKIIYSITFIAILLLLLILINIISFTRIDKKSYEVIRKDLEKIGGMLESIRINDNNISVERLSEFSDFANYYYGKSTVVMFSNIKAKMKFKSLCKSLANLENFIWDNHLVNAGGLTIRVNFIGSRSGVYDRNKHEEQEENEEKYRKLFIKTLNDYRSFRKYCENRL